MASGHALGVTVDADRPMLGLVRGAAASGRALAISSVDEIPPLPDGGERLAQSGEDSFLTVDWHEGLGYRIEARDHGRHLLSPDGREDACSPEAGADWPWHRLFFAQVLPSAAALQGLEVLHASAVSIAGEATAIVSVSGGGKSSLAVRLLAHGARFLTDDVLAVERGDDSLIAHPGPAFVRIDEAGAERVPGPSERLGSSDKLDVAVEPVRDAVPLRRLVFLERVERAGGLSLTPLSPPDPRLLLGATFTSHLTARRRLEAQLDTCAAIARDVPCFRLVVPGAVGPEEAAAALLEG